MSWSWRLAILMLPLAAASAAHGWEFTAARNAYGDAATAILQPAQNQPDAILAVGCDGDRWRVLSIGPRPGSGFKLDPDAQVRISFSEELGPNERWQTSKRAAGTIAYLAPTSSLLVRSMIQHEAKNPDAVLRAEVHSQGKPVLLEFPLAGLKAAVRKDLWEPCKMGNYIPESEFDAP
jgi:hypothetical protein